MASVTAFTGRGARVAARGKGVGGLDDDSLLDSIRCSGALSILHGNEAEGAVALGGIPEDPLEIGAGDDLADDDLLTVFQGHQAVGTASVLAADGGDADERWNFIGVVAIEDVSADGLVLVGAIVQRAGIGRIGRACVSQSAGSTSTTGTTSRPRAACIARTRGTTGGIGATRSTGTACDASTASTASTARSVRAASCIGTARVARTGGTISGIGTTCSTGATRSVGTTCGTGAACSVGTSRSNRTVRGARITTSADAASACTRARSRAGSCTSISARTCACTAGCLFAATVSLCVTVSNRSLLPPSARGEGGRSSRIRRAATTTTAATQGGSKGHGAQDGTCRQQGA